MSTIKSSDEHLTLNADGSSKDIKFQANGVEKASISSAGAFTSTTIDATKLTGTIPNFTSTGIDDNADATAITIDSSENVGIGTSPSYKLHTLIGAGEASGVGILNTSGQGLNIYTDSTAANADVSIDQGATGAGMIFRQNGTERMRIDSSGYLLANKMATSYANLQGPSGNSNITGTGNFTIMRVVENPDSLYNSSNGRFTCPVDGLYFMSAMSINTYSLNGTIQAIPKKNGTEILGVGRMYENQDHNHGGSATSGVVRCNSGDYLQWDWYGSIYDGPHSSASFALIHGET